MCSTLLSVFHDFRWLGKCLVQNRRPNLILGSFFIFFRCCCCCFFLFAAITLGCHNFLLIHWIFAYHIQLESSLRADYNGRVDCVGFGDVDCRSYFTSFFPLFRSHWLWKVMSDFQVSYIRKLLMSGPTWKRDLATLKSFEGVKSKFTHPYYLQQFWDFSPL